MATVIAVHDDIETHKGVLRWERRISSALPTRCLHGLLSQAVRLHHGRRPLREDVADHHGDEQVLARVAPE